LKHFAVYVLYETQTKAALAFKLDNVDAFTKKICLFYFCISRESFGRF